MTRRRWRQAASLLAVWLLSMLVVMYVLHRRHVRRIAPSGDTSFAELSRRTGAPADLLRSLSLFRLDRAGLETARPGRVRIVTLGDSFTYGDEVDQGLEYPALLRRRLAQAGLDNVEVLNFGFSGLGMAETLRVWERLAASYHPDFVLLGPEGMFLHRDESFHWDGAQGAVIHARYILDGDGLRFVDVRGDSLRQRFDDVYRFWPRLDYLRYDRSPPDFLQALLPEGKTIANPFYYTALTPEEEQRELYLRMLRRLADDAPQVVLLPFNEAMAEMGSRLGDRIVCAQLEDPGAGIYRRARRHLSAAGNDRVASAFFQVLTRQKPRTFEEVRLAPPPYAGPMPNSLPPFASAALWLDVQRAARLIRDENDALFSSTSAAALLALVPRGRDLASALVVPLTFVPPPEAAAELRLGDARHSLLLARIAADLPIFAAELPAGVVLDGPRILGGAGELTVGGQRAAEVTKDGTLQPGAGFFRAAAGDFLDVERLPREGEAHLELDGVRVPLGRFTRVRGEAPFDDRGLHHWLR